MAKWSDVVTLIALEGEPQTDDAGYFLPQPETRRDVYCNRASVGYSEFYSAAQTGLKTDLKLTVRSDEYREETLVEHCGKRYKVLRTYATKNGEFTELTLTDLTERGADDG